MMGFGSLLRRNRLALGLLNGERNQNLAVELSISKITEERSLMSDKKEVVIKLTDDQRAQIKSATGQDLTELKVGTIEGANPLAANPLDDRSNPTMILEDRSNPLAGSPLDDRSNPMSVLD